MKRTFIKSITALLCVELLLSAPFLQLSIPVYAIEALNEAAIIEQLPEQAPESTETTTEPESTEPTQEQEKPSQETEDPTLTQEPEIETATPEQEPESSESVPDTEISEQESTAPPQEQEIAEQEDATPMPESETPAQELEMPTPETTSPGALVITEPEQATSIPEQATADFYDITIRFEEMLFSYTPTWNPDTHQYESWATAENHITVVNNSVSENLVQITLTFIPIDGAEIDAVFTAADESCRLLMKNYTQIMFVLPSGGSKEIYLSLEGNTMIGDDFIMVGKLLSDIVPLSDIGVSEPATTSTHEASSEPSPLPIPEQIPTPEPEPTPEPGVEPEDVEHVEEVSAEPLKEPLEEPEDTTILDLLPPL